MYRVLKDFKDLEDNDFIYTENDIYPREENKSIDSDRINSLSSINNKREEILIERRSFSDMNIKELALYAKIFDIKFPKGSKREDMISFLENLDHE